MPTLADFLETGRIGPLALGVSKELVNKHLGEPDESEPTNNPDRWKYGVLELQFLRGRGELVSSVKSIALMFWHESENLPERLGMVGWLPDGRTDVRLFQAYLEGLGPIIYSERIIRLLGAIEGKSLAQIILTLPSGVSACFRKGKLCFIHLEESSLDKYNSRLNRSSHP